MNVLWDTYHVLGDVREERRRQLDKWGDQHHPDSWWMVIETEELGEVARAIFDGEDLLKIREELVQVAAVAVAWIEDIDSRIVE